MKALISAVVVLAVAVGVQATVIMETVPVGNQGNVGEWSGESYGGAGPDVFVGSVGYTYNIGKYEVTAGQYTEFLNAVADDDTYGLYNGDMWSHTRGCKIEQSGSPGNYTYSVAGDGANRPVNYVSWYDALRFANWTHNGQGSGDTENGSYDMTQDLTIPGSPVRNLGATWVLPSEDEWYKAAYYKGGGTDVGYWDYPTSSDSLPGRDMMEATNPGNNANYLGNPFPIDSPYYTTVAGEYELSDSPYGTFDQGGNVFEWNEALIYGSSRGLRAGSFSYGANNLHASNGDDHFSPAGESNNVGFRIAQVPEPATALLLLCGGLLGGVRRRRARAIRKGGEP